MLDNPLCTFLMSSISLLTTKTNDGIEIRYLNVHGHILRKDSIKSTEKLCAGFPRNGWELCFRFLFLEGLLEFELRDGDSSTCALRIIIQRHLVKNGFWR